MRKTTRTNLIRRNELTKEEQLIGIKVKTEDGVFVIPVVDVRYGEGERRMVRAIERQSNAARGSKFIKPSHSLFGFSYNQSMKGRKVFSD